MKAGQDRKGGTTASVLLAGAVTLLALPSAVLAFTADFSAKDEAGPSIEPAPVAQPSHGLSRALAIRSLAKGQLFPFTPAGIANQSERAVTVAVRVDGAAARAITVRGRSLAQQDGDASHLRIAPTGFSLGVSRGYRNFAQDITQQAAPPKTAMDLPDLHKYSLAPSRSKGDDSRFSPRISLEEKATTGRAPRTFGVDGSEVDLGGAYRVTGNLAVTAGVRYSQERERLTPLTDGKQDSQAVYVGTQFSF
ncbi:hypothetical protein HNO88_003341 [Novosphingobium chloroacetimidivorans]|uniref:Porin domain-containing protein n=1 Tax=Novosphingobium chloroacetimidivorans TaxID=1428314 RepID=A0A7W7NWW1_9SPHN|nr:hypothetical protein [Novosphingobium chloroacetimidivorans]MBB4860003.1 hypothetical protein [Novosphingobium chloroacetimidivorans]